MKQSNKYWKLNDFKKATEGMTFEEGRAFTADLVASIIASKEVLAEYDKAFFEKIGYSSKEEIRYKWNRKLNDIEKTIIPIGTEKYAWNKFIIVPFKINHKGQIAIKEFAMNLHSYLQNPVGMKLMTVILKDEPTDPKLKVKSKVHAKLLIYELSQFFKKYTIVDAYIKPTELGRRVFNAVETGYRKSYVVSLFKTMTEHDYNKIIDRQKNW